MIICSFVGKNVWLNQCWLAVRMHIHTALPCFCLLVMLQQSNFFAHICCADQRQQAEKPYHRAYFSWTFLWDHHWNKSTRLSGSKNIIPLKNIRVYSLVGEQYLSVCYRHCNTEPIYICRLCTSSIPNLTRKSGTALLYLAQRKGNEQCKLTFTRCMQMALRPHV